MATNKQNRAFPERRTWVWHVWKGAPSVWLPVVFWSKQCPWISAHPFASCDRSAGGRSSLQPLGRKWRSHIIQIRWWRLLKHQVVCTDRFPLCKHTEKHSKAWISEEDLSDSRWNFCLYNSWRWVFPGTDAINNNTRDFWWFNPIKSVPAPL